MVLFAEETLNGRLLFLCTVNSLHALCFPDRISKGNAKGQQMTLTLDVSNRTIESAFGNERLT